MNSPYEKNNYGFMFENYPLAWRYNRVVELGADDGYSTLHFARGLFNLHKAYNHVGKVNSYDSFLGIESKESIDKLIADNGLADYANVIKADPFEAHKNHADKSVEILHVNLSNTGETLKRVMETWDSKLVERAIILFEGGSVEQDNIERMNGKPLIREELNRNEIIRKQYPYGTYFPYPSMTLLFKNYEETRRE